MKHEVDEGMPVLRVRTFDAEAADEDRLLPMMMPP